MVVCLSTPADAKRLTKVAVRRNDPVILYEHVKNYTCSGEAPTDSYTYEIGEAAVEREGSDVTVVATQIQLWNALEAAEELAEQGISVEVVAPSSRASEISANVSSWTKRH